jgi:3-oxoacyl-[acyl-carrier protein] reductase
MDTGLNDKVAFITGASGGIGQALTAAFRAERARVAACSRRGVPASDRVLSVLADVRRLDQVEAAMAEALAACGRVDVCVVNAGIWPKASLPLHQLPEARVREVMETNLLGAIWTARAFLGALARTGPRADGHGASLVFIGSTAGRFGEAGHAEYAATKAALRGLTLSLKNEIVALDPWARVNLVEPGWTVTPMAAATLEASGALDQVTRTMPLRRVATPEDVAAAVMYLASPTLSRHVSGETITVAGGMEGRALR